MHLPASLVLAALSSGVHQAAHLLWELVAWQDHSFLVTKFTEVLKVYVSCV